MRKILFNSIIITACSIMLIVNVNAQVRTKIYFDKFSNTKISDLIQKGREIKIPAPPTFEKLLQNEITEDVNLREYKNRFALPVNVNIDFFKTANRWEENGLIKYSLSLNAEDALNISIQFNEFLLSKNSILSIFNSNEFTDSITYKENNINNVWATRIYQGNSLYLTFQVPENEEGVASLKISQVGFGYKKIGGEFFGVSGASASCNINVTCPEGIGWENERNSVALIVSNSIELCTGTLVMNTCGNNRPYLLTANHCLNSNVQNWVFQFQTWSNTCSPNGTFREDLQFNGCQLRANNAASDFALVELNQIPSVNSGITYAGWTRDPNPALRTTAIHHPMGDLMKISHDFQSPISVSYQGGANNHWRAIFDQGIVQHGSSGSALFDQNHRIIGQLHGNQNNICPSGNNYSCWCVTQIPSIGEYGRFDVSWTGNGTDATRLSNWLDPNNSNALTTNTTNISYLTRNITGPSTVCSSNAIYAVTNLPSGLVVNWTFSPNLIYVSGQGTNQLVVKSSDGDPLPLVSLSYDNYGSSGWVRAGTCNNVVLEKTIWVGLPAYTPIVTGSSTMFCSQSLYVEKYNRNATWSVYGPLQVIGVNYGYKCTVKGTESGVGWVYATNSNLCGSFRGEKLVQVTCSSYSVFPNPTNSEVTISLLADNSIDGSFQKNKSIKSIRVVDKSGITLSVQKYGSETFETKIDLSKFTSGLYIIKINEGIDEESYTIVKQ